MKTKRSYKYESSKCFVCGNIGFKRETFQQSTDRGIYTESSRVACTKCGAGINDEEQYLARKLREVAFAS